MFRSMCELFSLSCNQEDRATRTLPIFSELYSESNPDGWGVGWFEGNTAHHKSAPGRADADSLFEEAMEKARSNTIIAHVRIATGDTECSERNCHPFKHIYRDRGWLFAHNGYLTNEFDRHPDAKGETDSETIFLEIMDKVAEYQQSGTFKGQYPAIKAGIKHILDTYGSEIRLNLMISDGRTLYIFHHYQFWNGRYKPIFILRRQKRYGSAILLSTQRLTDENWEPLPKDCLLAISGGEILIISDPLIRSS